MKLAKDDTGPANLMHFGSTPDMENVGNVLLNVKLERGLCTLII
jgi:hypothetical protein